MDLPAVNLGLPMGDILLKTLENMLVIDFDVFDLIINGVFLVISLMAASWPQLERENQIRSYDLTTVIFCFDGMPGVLVLEVHRASTFSEIFRCHGTSSMEINVKIQRAGEVQLFPVCCNAGLGAVHRPTPWNATVQR